MYERPNYREIIKGIEEDCAGNISEYARAIGHKRRIVSYWYKDALLKRDEQELKDQLGVFDKQVYIITAAQIDTDIHKGFFKNLLKLKEVYNAELMIPGVTYNVREENQKNNMGSATCKVIHWLYDQKVQPYLMNDNVRLNRKIEVLGKLNILPTAVNPLSGYQSFTGERSAILPHCKIALESVPTRPGKLAKFLLTSGFCTVPNFIQKNAGIKGEFHHQLGAVIVEVIDEKQFHVRHVLAEEDGSFYDLIDYYQDGQVTTGHRAEALVYGDIHHINIDPVVEEATWGKEGLAEFLDPKNQVFHDVLDFKIRNHHNRDNPNFMKMNCTKSVQYEVQSSLEFIQAVEREDCNSYVVKSNHDHAFTRWVQECSAFDEPDMDNAAFLSIMQAAMYQGMIKHPEKSFDAFIQCSKTLNLEKTKFLDQDESLNIDGVECGMHGDAGLNGGRGTLKSFAKIGCKATVGHSHSAGIFEGTYQVGCSCKIKADYTRGPSSWSHTHCIQYPNGKRTLITCINGQFFGERPEGLKQLTLKL